MQFPKKLIEVALPLNDINAAAAREKSIRHGHPSTLHIWWARRPLAAARAVLFAQLVNDPGTKAKREKLFALMRELVIWENSTNEDVLRRARAEIRKSWEETCRLTGEDPNKMPPLHDPFAGGGAIPLEAQRLGFEAHASDLNPVAVLINKSMIEIPPRFAGRAPVGPVPSRQRQLGTSAMSWPGASGLAEDVRRYGLLMRDKAEQQLSNLYPAMRLPKELGGTEGTVIAWLWARTVASPDPARKGAHVPLVSSFWLSKKPNKLTWVEPVIDGPNTYHFEVRTGKEGPKLDETVNRQGGICLLSGVKIPFSYVRTEAKAGRMKAKLMAVVIEGKRGRVYLDPSEEQENIAVTAMPSTKYDIAR
jgi:putative DNA methylase